MTKQLCIKCGKEATKTYSPDLDIRGIGSCEECLEAVGFVYIMIIQGTPEMAESATKEWAYPLKFSKEKK